MRVTFEVLGDAPSTPNLREHYMARARRTKAQRAAVQRLAPKWEAGPLLVVTLTRVGKRRLDDDNVRGALKAYRDGVADWLKVDDASPLVRWEYRQETGEPSVRVEVCDAGCTVERGLKRGSNSPPCACADCREDGEPLRLPLETAVEESALRKARAPRDLAALATANVRRRP